MKVLNRDQIKYLAIVLMLLDHIIQVLNVCSGMTYEVLDSLTHFTYITMSYFLVEGFFYTRSKKLYVKRIFIFALIAQIPFSLAFSFHEIIGLTSLNVFYSLGIGFLMIWAIDSTDKKWKKCLYAILGIIFSTIGDWSFFAGIFTLLFYIARGNKKKQLIAYIVDIVLFNLLYTSGYIANGDIRQILLNFAIGSIGFTLSAICTLLLYNGKKSEKHIKFNKWFFYVFYPAHLLILGILRIIYCN